MAFPWAAVIPGAISLFGSLFGKKRSDKDKAQYTTTMSPEQQKYYTYLLQMLQNRNRQSPAAGPYNQALNTIYSSFFGKPYQQQSAPPMAGSMFPNQGPPPAGPRPPWQG